MNLVFQEGFSIPFLKYDGPKSRTAIHPATQYLTLDMRMAIGTDPMPEALDGKESDSR